MSHGEERNNLFFFNIQYTISGSFGDFAASSDLHTRHARIERMKKKRVWYGEYCFTIQLKYSGFDLDIVQSMSTAEVQVMH